MKKLIFALILIIIPAGIFIGYKWSTQMEKTKYTPGEPVETYNLVSDSGDTVTLPEKRWTVLYFYPKDDTPGCTEQAKGFTALYDDYTRANIAVYGISTDSHQSHREFREKHQLKVTLLSDPQGELASDFGVTVMLGMCARDAVILNPNGSVDKINRGVSPKSSPAEVIEYIIEKQKTGL